jgi:hypothetical protein
MTQIRRPEDVWLVDDEYAEDYHRRVAEGLAVAKEQKATIVAIARNALPLMANTFDLLCEVQAGFADCKMFVFENDSTDGTDAALDRAASVLPWLTVEHATLGGEDSRGFEPERTIRLAHCRNRCLEWVREHRKATAFTIVLDMDPEYGFSVDGVFNSICWLATKRASATPLQAGGMASYSLWRMTDESGQVGFAHYDAWAARPNWWRDRRDEIGFTWFSHFLPPVGSPPCPMNSAFGGLAVYWTEAFLSGGYSGGDCEHVPHHRRMQQAGWQMYLNPGSRYIATFQ